MLHRIPVAVVATLALSLSIVGLPDAHADKKSDAGAKHYEKARKHIDKKEWASAESELIHATSIAEEPAYVVDLCMVYDMEHQDGEMQVRALVIEQCELAVKISSGDLRKRAKKHFASLQAQFDAEDAKNDASAAKSHLEDDRLDDAQRKYESAIELDPKPEYMLGLCRVYARKGEAKKATAMCKKAKSKAKTDKLKRAIDVELAAVDAAVDAAPSGDQQTHLDALDAALKTLSFVNIDGRYREDEVVGHIATAKSCVDAVDALLASGMKAKAPVRVTHNKAPNSKKKQDPDGQWAYEATLGDVRTMCVDFYDGLGMRGVAEAVIIGDKALTRVNELLETTNVAGDVEGYFPARNRCTQAVKDGLERGVSPKAKIDLGDGRSVTLGDAEAKVCKALGDAIGGAKEAIAARLKAVRDAALVPYKKVLKADKIRLIDDGGFFEIEVLGAGGTVLGTPEKLAKAAVWFIVSTRDESDGYTHWISVRYQFSGHKLKKTTESQGKGDWPPSKTFR